MRGSALAMLLAVPAASCGGRALFGDAGGAADAGDAASDAGADGSAEQCPPCDGVDEDGDGSFAPPCGHDCDDGDASRAENAADPVGDGIDQSCDGVDGLDRDRDGHLAIASGGDDCDDGDAGKRPGENDGEGWRVSPLLIERSGRSYPWYGGTSVRLDSDGFGHLHRIETGCSEACNGEDGKNEEPPDEFGGPGPRYSSDVGGALALIGEALADCITGRTAIAAAPDGTVHVAYTTSSSHNSPRETTHAVRRDGAWEITVVDPVGRLGGSPLVLDACGHPWIAYAVPIPVEPEGTFGCQVRLATQLEDGWTVEPVEDVCPIEIAVARSNDGTFWLAYTVWTEPLTDDFAAELHVATGRFPNVQIEVVDSTEDVRIGGAGGVRIAVSGATPHVLYVLGPGSLGPTIRHAVLEADGWRVEEAFAGSAGTDSQGTHSPLTLLADDEGGLHASYVAQRVDAGGTRWVDVRYATLQGSSWATTTLVELPFEGWRAGEPALALLPRRRPVLMFADEASATYVATLSEPNDGVDQNCDGVDGTDADGDGVASVATGGDDPDDDDGL